MKPQAKVDISPEVKQQENRGKQAQLVKTEQPINRSTLEVTRNSRLQLDELDMIVTTRGTYYYQN
jgi:hypothetical protein